MRNCHYRPAAIDKVLPQDSIIRNRLEICRTSTIPSSIVRSYETGRIDAFRLQYKPGDAIRPCEFWDSDVAKVLEGMAYMLKLHPDAEMERQYDEIVGLIASAQQSDGYLNVHYTVVKPEMRWKNLRMNHELYCAGHLMEAAVAGFQMLGKRKLLDVMCRYADYIDSCFGREEGKMRGYPGHPEIELALIRLYEATGEKRYFNLAEYFVNERGQAPNYFDEVEKQKSPFPIEYFLAEKPVREQTDAHGHAVRACYLYCGMADVAARNGDEELFQACERAFDCIVNQKMYITGGIGSTFSGEAFTTPYDLANGSLMYAESCAAISLVYFTNRMLNITGDGKYADVMERAVFNGVFSGISLTGERFFYTNYLEVDDNTQPYLFGAKTRQPWFECSCCPTNFCRFIPEMLQYIWSESDDEIRLNLPVANIFESKFGTLEVSGGYPYDGNIKITVNTSGKFKVAIRIPGWCRNAELRLNGEKITGGTERGYVTFDREWQPGDTVYLCLDMPIKAVRSNFKVTGNAGRIALMRGPLVYACETVDNPAGISNMVIPVHQEFKLKQAAGLPAGTVAITGKAVTEEAPEPEALYYSGELIRREIEFTAIPYALWQNRGAANMAVWIRTEE